MKVFRTVEDLREFLDGRTAQNQSIGFVPTMGALHKGHISLVEYAKEQTDCVVVSLFVNPTQFNDPKDLERYPRTEQADLEMLENAGVDVVFVPSVEVIYPQKDERVFDFGDIEKVMEGASRPGHFNGVVQVVSRLFDIVEPNKAFFGEKDFQQLAIIRKMVKELGYDKKGVQIVGCPIVRAEDGLALSSRNALLDQLQRSQAPMIYQALGMLAKHIQENRAEILKTEVLIEQTASIINEIESLEVEYIDIVDPDTLQHKDSIKKGECVRICAAVKCGIIRLIDNMGACRC